MGESNGGAILLVGEASGGLHAALESIVASRGLVLEAVHSVTMATARLAERPDDFRAVVLDVRAVGRDDDTDGAVRELAPGDRGVPVLAVATDMPEDVVAEAVRFVRAGTFDYVVEGMGGRSLETALDAACDVRAATDRTRGMGVVAKTPAFLDLAPPRDGEPHACGFALRLRGLASRSLDWSALDVLDARQREWVGKLTSNLHHRDRCRALEVRYLATPRDGAMAKTMITVYLVGLAWGDDREAARRDAQEMWREAEPLLRLGDPYYTFAVVDGTQDLASALRPFRATAMFDVTSSMGRLVVKAAQGSLGFVGRHGEGEEVSLDLPHLPRDEARSLRPMLEMLRDQAQPIQVVVRLASGRLDPEEQALVNQVLAQLSENTAPSWRIESVDGVTLTSSAKREAGEEFLSGLLARLVEHYEVGCRVEVAGKIARTLPAVVAESIFGGESRNRIVTEWSSDEVDSWSRSWGNFRRREPIARRLKRCLPVDDAPAVLLLPRANDGGVVGIDSVPMSYGYFPPDLPTSGLRVGEKRTPSGYFPIMMREEDRLRHTYILGQTGTGKSTLLATMAIQDMEQGRGISVLDPHGDLVEELLAAVPRERVGDVVLFDLSDIERPIGLNLLDYDRRFAHQKTFIINEMMTIFDDLYDLRTAGGPIFENYMRNAMLLLMGDPELTATLMDVARVFVDRSFRTQLLDRCQDESVEMFWRQALEARGESGLANVAPYVTSKLNQFVSNDIVRPIIGQRRTAIDFRDALDSGKIVLVKLVKGYVGEITASLIGMVFAMRIMAAALSRVGTPASHRRPHYLYVDEFQSFTSRSVPQMLAEVRKYGLGLVLANQNLFQLRDATLNAVLGNVGTTLFFRPGPIDAERILPYLEPNFSKSDLVTLPNFTIVGRLLTSHVPTPAFLFNTGWRPRPIDPAWVDEVRKRSRDRYGSDAHGA